MTTTDTTPYWSASASMPRFAAVDRDLTVDVAVIGGGLTGITSAYLLKSAGLSVALIERDRCANVDSGHTTAHLAYVTDARVSDLVKHFGREGARAVWDAGRVAQNQIAANVEAEEIDCDFGWVNGYLHSRLDSAEKDESEQLRDDAELARELGFDAEFLASVPLVAVPGIRFDRQAKFHPRKYLSALARTIPGDGSHVFENSNVDEVTDEPLAAKAKNHTIRCDYVVIATHTPLMGKANIVSATFLQSKLAPYTTYAIGAKVARGVLDEALFWDTADPYHYLRVDSHRGFDYAIFGGEDHKTGQASDTDACFKALEQTFSRMVPDIEITHRWSGQVIETNDGLPFIGETSPRQFVATGFSGNGMTFGTLAGMMARDAALGRENPWRDLFEVNRTKVRGGTWDYLKENKDYLYYMVRDRLAGPEGKSLRGLRRGQGKILEIKGERVAAFRDSRGSVTLRSPVCTHMGCLVQWNEAEATWDCPCHGSRFRPNGEVLAGPAESPLEARD
ncbi:MAG: FAD-dependent oxidoreductase [Gemmatimonadaceae bacterium]